MSILILKTTFRLSASLYNVNIGILNYITYVTYFIFFFHILIRVSYIEKLNYFDV